MKMDRAVNIITYAGVLLLTLGALTAIWGGLAGLKIAGSGAVLIFTAMAFNPEYAEMAKRRLEGNK
nr:MAG TPA: hypothetical protein [Caudoviricetes sp.]